MLLTLPFSSDSEPVLLPRRFTHSQVFLLSFHKSTFIVFGKPQTLPTMACLPLLGPIIGLNLWHFVMEGWMYHGRISHVQKAKMPMDPRITKAQFDAKMPPEIRWKADNYNHLFEQPTQFYAVLLVQALVLGAMPGKSATIDVGLAWTYVGLRVV